jgi:hypothetical protein
MSAIGKHCPDKRMVMFIKYHLNELNHVKKQPDDKGVLKEIPTKERQAFRGRISQTMIRQNWTHEAMKELEKARACT